MKFFNTRSVVLMAVAFLVGLCVALFVMREPMVKLDKAGLSVARAKWSAAGIHDYDMRYRMNGSEYKVVVRGDIVQDLTVNDRPARTSDWASYSVEGIFDLLALELDNLSDPAGPFRGGTQTVVARVRFNPTLGYVERYLRAGGGMPHGASIELVSFVPVQASE